jgi:hypothetical protein
MSNPSINRWGINTFWYSFWYSDNRYSENLKQDSLFIKLLNLYLYYGVNTSINIFANVYWYSKQFKTLHLLPYSRQLTFKNPLLQTQSSYSLRHKTDSIYPMKLWLLKYNNWLVINLYWFQPFKKKHRKTQNDKLVMTDLFGIHETKTFNSLIKIKTLFSVNFFNKINKKFYYQF